MLKGQEILKKLGLIPKLINIQIQETEENCSFVTNLEVIAKNSKKELEWNRNKEILSMLRIKLIYSFSNELTQKLSSSLEESLKQKSESNICHVYDNIIQTNNKPTKTLVNNIIQVSDTITHTFNVPSMNLNHLSLTTIIYLDNNILAEKFKISPSSITDTFATFSHEILIENNKSNDKIQRLNVIKKIGELNLNLSFVENFEKSIQAVTLNKLKTNYNGYFSELFSSFSSNKEVTLTCIVDLEQVFLKNCKFSNFFLNQLFFKDYFSSSTKNKPKQIVVIRHDDFGGIEYILNTEYKSKIITSQASLIEVDIYNPKNTLFCFTIQDLTSSKLNGNYTYEIQLEFEDRTISYLTDIKEKIQTNSSLLNKIINLVHFKNYFNFDINRFDERFFNLLSSENMSLTQIVNEFENIISKLTILTEQQKNDLKLLGTSKAITIVHIELLQILHNLLLSEISKLENNGLKTASTKISIFKWFLDQFNLSTHNLTTLSVLEQKSKNETLKITTSDLKTRIRQEILKYYKTDNLNLNNTFILTGFRMYSREIDVNLNNQKISELNFDIYNKFIIDLLFSKQSDLLNVSTELKALQLLKQFGIVSSQLNDSKNIEKDVTFDREIVSKIQSLNEEIDIPYELSLFLILSSIVFPGQSFNFFEKLDNKSIKSKISNEFLNKLPFQLKSIYDSLNQNSFVNKTVDSIKEFQDPLKLIGYYLQFKQLYELQYLDINSENKFVWKALSNLKLLNGKEIICKWNPYLKSEFNLYENKNLNFLIENQIFILINE